MYVGRMEVEIHLILISAPDGNECSASQAGCFKYGVTAIRPTDLQVAGWALRALDDLEKRKFSCPC
jgi:hypothetical protein